MMMTVCCDPKPHQNKHSIMAEMAKKLVLETGSSVEIHYEDKDEEDGEKISVFLSPDGKGGVRPTHG